MNDHGGQHIFISFDHDTIISARAILEEYDWGTVVRDMVNSS